MPSKKAIKDQVGRPRLCESPKVGEKPHGEISPDPTEELVISQPATSAPINQVNIQQLVGYLRSAILESM